MAVIIAFIAVIAATGGAWVIWGNKIVFSMVGDSITAGHGTDTTKYSWPAQFATMLKYNSKYEVRNFGDYYRCVTKSCDFPYWKEQIYQKALTSKPNYLVIMLGTNDAKPINYNKSEFTKDYILMVKSFQALTPPPDIYMMIPPPLYIDKSFGISQKPINDVYPTLIPKIAK